MYIAFITSEYPHKKISHSGGIGTSIKNLVEALVAKGVSVALFVYSQEEDTVIVENGVTIHLIKRRRYSMFTWYFYRKFIQSYINKVVAEENIDLLEACDWTGVTAFMKFDAPLVIRFHGSDAYFCDLEQRPQKIKNFWFEKLAVKGASAYIAPTTFAGENSKRIFKISDQKEIKTIHYGLELERFENVSPEKYQKNLLLYIGTIIRKKGVFEFPEILKHIWIENPAVELVMIGADSYDLLTGKDSTWELLKENFTPSELKKIKYIGKVPYLKVQEYIKKAHVCVFPTFAETLGMVTIESMALKKAVVNSNIGWSKELIIDEESGYLVHPTKHEKYADRILRVINDEKLMRRIGDNARERIEKVFDIRDKVDENISFYSKIIQLNR